MSDSSKIVSCIFCSYPLVKTGTLEFSDNSKKKINLCAQCNLPRKWEDMKIILDWEEDTGKKVYGVKADWKEIKEHFILHGSLKRNKKD